MACLRATTVTPAIPLAAALALAVMAALLTGCGTLPQAADSFGPALAAPSVPPAPEPLPALAAPAELPRPQADMAVPPSASRGAAPVLETIEDAWAAARVSDASLEALQSQAAAHHEEFLAARSQRWPTATVGGAYTVRSDQPSILLPSLLPGSSPTFSPYLPLDQVLLRGQVALPLYTGKRITSEIQAAAARSTALQQKLTRHQLDTRLLIAEEFLAVLRAQHELEIADSQVRNLEAHLRDSHALLARGSASRQDLLKAEMALADARHQAILAGQALELGRATYNQRLSRPLDWPVRLAPVPVPPMALDFNELTDRALAQNAEIRELQAQSEALTFESEAAASISRPQVQMLGAYTYAENPFQHPQALAEAGLGASWNLFDGGGGRHRAAARKHAAAAAARLGAEAASRIQLDIRRTGLELLAARERLHATQQAIAAAEESLRASRIRFQSGAATGSDVLDGEALRVRALRNHFHAHDAVALAHLRLLHATSDL